MTILSDHHPPPRPHSSPSPPPAPGSPLPSSSYSTFSAFDPPGGSFDGSSSLEVSRPFLRLESYSFSDHSTSSDGEPPPPLVTAAAPRRVDSVSSSSVSTSVEPGGRGGVTRTPLPSRDIFDVQEVGDSQDEEAQEEEDSDLESQSQGHHRRSSSSPTDGQPPPRFVITGCSPRNQSNSILSPPSLLASPPSWPSPFDDAEDDHDYDATMASLSTPLTPRPRPSSWSQPVPPPRTSSRANLRSFSAAQQQQQQPQGQHQHQRHGSEQQRSRRPLTPYPGYGCTTTAISEDMAASTNRFSAATATATPADPMVARTLDLLKPTSPVNVPEHWPWCGAAGSSTLPWSFSYSPGLQQRRRSPPTAAAAAAALSPNIMAHREEQAASGSQLWSHPNPFADVDAWHQDRHHAQDTTREHMHSPLESETATLTDSLAPAQQAAAASQYPPSGQRYEQDQPPARLPASSSSTRDRLRWYYDRVMHPRRSSTMQPTAVPQPQQQPQHSRYDSTNTLLGGKVSTEGTVRARPTTGGTNWLNGYHSLATTAAYPPTTTRAFTAPSPDVTSGGMLSYEEALRRNQNRGRRRSTQHKTAGAGGGAAGGEDGKPVVREQRRRLSAGLWPRSLLHSTASSTSLSDESDWDSQCGVGESFEEYAAHAGRSGASPQPGVYPPPAGAAAAAATPSLAGLAAPPLLTPGIPSYHLLLHHLVSQWDETLLYLESSHLHTFDSPSTPRVISRFLVFRLPPITLFILLASFFIYICFRYEVPPALYGLMGSITVGAMAWATFACQRGEENMDKEREGEARLLRQRWLKGKVRERRRKRRGERGRIKEVDKACRRAALLAQAQMSAQAVAKAEEEERERMEERRRQDRRGAARSAPRPRPRPRTSQSAPPLHGAWATTGTRGILTSPSNANTNTVRNTSAAGQPTVGFALPNSPHAHQQYLAAQPQQQQQRRTSASGLGGAAVGLGRASMNPWAGGAAARQSSAQHPHCPPKHPLDISGRFDSALEEEDEFSTTINSSTTSILDQHPAFFTSFDENDTASHADLSLSQRRDWIERWAREASFAPLWAPPSVRQGLGAMEAVQQRAPSASSRAATVAPTAAVPPTATATAAAAAAAAATAVASAVVMTVPPSSSSAQQQQRASAATPTGSGALTTPTITTGTTPTMSGTPPTSSSAAARRPLLPPPSSSQQQQQHGRLRSTAGSSVMRSHAGNGASSHVGSATGGAGGAGANRRRPRAGSRSIVVAGAAATVAAGAAAGASAVAWQGGGGGAGSAGGMWGGGGGGAGASAGGFAGAI